MPKLSLYHGSKEIVEKPLYGIGKPYNDYGTGFYCTKHIEIAKEWACGDKTDGYVNCYEIDTNNLSILNLSERKYNILNWLAILMENRIVKFTNPLAKKSRDYIIANFLLDYKKYDVIIGYRADDSYFSFVRDFVSNTISLEQLKRAMKLGKLGEQFVLISKKAFDYIEFIKYEVVDCNEYYNKRKNRDEKARKEYLKELEDEDINGIFMRDILLEEIKNNDQRLF